MSTRKFITLYAKKGWSVGYWPHYTDLRDYEYLEIRTDDCAYSGRIVRGSRAIPQEVKEVYFFWCGMLEE